MSGYGQNPQQGYGQYNPYGQQNPYDQRADNQSAGGYNNAAPPYPQGNPYAQQDNYSQQRPDLQQHSSSRYDEERGQGGYEMAPVGATDPNRFLNEIRTIDREIDQLENDQKKLTNLRARSLNEVNPASKSPVKVELDRQTAYLMESYKGLVERVKMIKQNPQSGNPRNAPQVGKIDRRLKNALRHAQQLDVVYRQEQRDQIARQYLIVRPEASDQEVREVQENLDNTQIFSDALLASDRRGEAHGVLTRVKDRHDEIAALEKEMAIVAQLFNDLEAAVIQQENQVAAIEDKADVAQEHVTQATVQLDGAIEKAKAARKKKWICLGIVVLIIIIVIAVAVGVVEANKKT